MHWKVFGVIPKSLSISTKIAMDTTVVSPSCRSFFFFWDVKHVMLYMQITHYSYCIGLDMGQCDNLTEI